MAGAKLGDKVKFHYVIKDDSGKVLENSPENEPEELVIGEGDIFSGVEITLMGMSPGDSKAVTLKPPMHFGPRVDELKIDISMDQVPDDVKIEDILEKNEG